jgi:hypothetical protein
LNGGTKAATAERLPTGSMRNVNINIQRKRATLPQHLTAAAGVQLPESLTALRSGTMWNECVDGLILYGFTSRRWSSHRRACRLVDVAGSTMAYSWHEFELKLNKSEMETQDCEIEKMSAAMDAYAFNCGWSFHSDLISNADRELNSNER